jgi:5-methyltetrahydrofolate corrinoid/iron sulfur protein methyltransferase
MFVIGESIHIISPKVKQAIMDRDKKLIQDLAVRQVEGGANALDLNIGPQKKEGPEVMAWMVDTVQEVVDVPLSLDTTNLAAIEEGLKKVKQQAIINSTSAQPERLESLPPLALKYGARIIALTLGTEGIPVSAEARVSLALEVLMPRFVEIGLPLQNVFLDPLILTVKGMQEHVPQAIEAVRFLGQISDPPPNTLVGLSNVSNGVPAEMRSLINRTYLVMLLGAGLKAAIVDALDAKLMGWIRVVEKRDDSTPLNRLLLGLHDAVTNMGEIGPEAVDMNDPEQVEVYKTVQILTNKIIYADSFLKV